MRFLPLLLLVALGPALRAADQPGRVPVESQVLALAADEKLTVVRLWAPWCGNCRAEMKPEGWAKFIAAHPDVQFVFVCIWHRDQDPAPQLQAAGLGGQPNLTLLRHPSGASRGPDRMARFLDLPVTWIPATWVLHRGKLRYAFNYGEIRFEILGQLLQDATHEWKH